MDETAFVDVGVTSRGPTPKTSKLAVASFACGLITLVGLVAFAMIVQDGAGSSQVFSLLFELGVHVLPPVGLALGAAAIWTIRRQRLAGLPFSLTGIVLSAVPLVLTLFLWISALTGFQCGAWIQGPGVQCGTWGP